MDKGNENYKECYYQNYFKMIPKYYFNFISILILFHPVAKIDQLLANGSIV